MDLQEKYEILGKKRVRTRVRAYTFTQIVVMLFSITLVVAILATVILRIRGNKRENRQEACASNLRSISLALMQYAQDNDNHMPADVTAPSINGGRDHRIPYDQQLAPYIKNDLVYSCPSDTVPRGETPVWAGQYTRKRLKRSYALSDTIVTEETIKAGSKLDKNTGILGRSVSEIEQPASTISLSESWGQFGRVASDSVVGAHSGSTMFGCDTWKLPGRHVLGNESIDKFPVCREYENSNLLPSAGHNNLGVYAFADGHVATLTWQTVRHNDFWCFKIHKSARVFSP